MARLNVVTIDTNVTPDQAAEIDRVRAKLGVNRAQLVRMALATFIERNDGQWPTAEIKHGGNRHPPLSEGNKESA